MFETSGATAQSNSLRAQWEPLVEITQHKGESECRTGFGTNDENCNFRKFHGQRLGTCAILTKPFNRCLSCVLHCSRAWWKKIRPA